MIDQLLLIIGAMIFGVLGSIHLLYTFYSNKFNARDESVTSSMKNISPVLTSQTTMWKAWIGFNASHSLGAILVPAFFVPLALTNMQLVRESVWFSLLPVLIGLSYLFLAKQYWFRIPFVGILVSTMCFVSTALLIHF